MKVLLTGATGFTGSHALTLLLERAHQVRCFVRPSSSTEALPQGRVELAEGDLGDESSLVRALSGVDALVNVASLGFGHGPGIVRALKAAKVQRCLFVSTTAVFTSLNAPSKVVRLEAERTVIESGLDYTILRPTMIYGTARDRNMCRLVRYLRRWPVLPVLGNGQFAQQPIYVGDVASALVLALESPKAVRRCYNISGAQALTFNEVIDVTCRLLRRKVWKLHLPAGPMVWALQKLESAGLALPIKAEQILRLNEDKAFPYEEAARDFGFKPLSFAEGIAREIAEMGFVS